jgi:hypothetical protein
MQLVRRRRKKQRRSGARMNLATAAAAATAATLATGRGTRSGLWRQVRAAATEATARRAWRG